MTVDAERQARLKAGIEQILNSQDPAQARTRTAYLTGYIDALVDESLLAEDEAQTLRSAAIQRRDKRLTEMPQISPDR